MQQPAQPGLHSIIDFRWDGGNRSASRGRIHDLHWAFGDHLVPVRQIRSAIESQGLPETIPNIVVPVDDEGHFIYPLDAKGGERAFHESPADALSPIGDRDRRMVDEAPPAVMAAQDDAHDAALFDCDETRARVALEILLYPLPAVIEVVQPHSWRRYPQGIDGIVMIHGHSLDIHDSSAFLDPIQPRDMLARECPLVEPVP